MYSSLMDHNSINTSVIKGEKRMATAMHKCTQRSPCENDSRRSIEKLKYKIFEVVLPVSTDQELGPGRYSHQRPTDIGLEKRKFQAWKSPIRNPNWWQLKTDAPEGDTLYKNSPFDMPSRNKCGGYLKECWPQPQDEYGRPLTTAMFTAHSPLSSPTRKKGKPPATA
mmetsp:Transcript_71120/g.115393  ORF Transcript_71120/g.115393 Transcript_71120/m.115393 type:complete len:167 (-) Transcript_71120:454-954(-)